MEPEVGGLTGVPYDEKSAERRAQHIGDPELPVRSRWLIRAPGTIAARANRQNTADRLHRSIPKSDATRSRGNPLVSAFRTASCLKSSLCLILSSVSLNQP